MPLTVLLIDSDALHAQAVVDALSDPWTGWSVHIAGSLAQARTALQGRRHDIALAAHRLSDGTAFDLLPEMDGVPAMIVVAGGEEADAAQALRHGFSDYAVRDAACNHLLILPAQIEAVLERHSSAQARVAAEAMLARHVRLLQAISQAQATFISSAGPGAAFRALLDELMVLTDSAFGLVGPVERAGDGHPFLRIHALTDLSWDEASRARYAQHAQEGMVFDNARTLIGAALHTGQPILCNDVENDPRGSGVPPGHPPLQTYVGLPIHAGGELVAMVGLANRVPGYTLADVRFLQPLLGTVGQLELARRAALARSAVEEELARTSTLLSEKTRALQVTLGSVAQGISTVDAQGRLRIYNQRYLELLDLPDDLLRTQPPLQEVVRYQAARGDFGTDWDLVEPASRVYIQSEVEATDGPLLMPEMYVRRTRAGRYLEVRTRVLEQGGWVRTFADVTDYMGTLDALRQSEARWRSLTQLSSDWYWEQDENFRFVRLDGNPVLAHGYPHELQYGLTRWELSGTMVSDSEWAKHRDALQAHEVFHDFEMQRRLPHGDVVWVSISGEPIWDAQGQFTGYRGVARDVTARKNAEAQIQRLAFYDELTGLPNRRLLLDRLERTAAACARDASHGALLFLDLDNFKGINDTMGHDWGDQLLVQVAARLGATVRSSDLVARLGGDEFVVVVHGLPAQAQQAASELEALARAIQAALHPPYVVHGREVHSTSSIGIALFHDVQHPVHELLKRADLAMYQAKSQGRNTTCFFDPKLQAAASQRSALEDDLRHALAHNAFVLHYQAVVNEAGAVLGAEALVRWRHPERGVVSPGEFIPLAEQTGLILPLGRQVLAMACAQLAQWSAQPATAAWTVAVNVSAHEFRQPDFAQQVLAVLRSTGANPHQLKLELTESLLLQDVEASILKMHDLRTHGVGFSLDDFGTGYSSLSYLKRLPLDQLKIDQSFVRDVLTDPNDATIACTIITLAQSLGLDVVAEGVETQGQRAFLLRHGCHQFQGYLWGQPGPAELLEKIQK